VKPALQVLALVALAWGRAWCEPDITSSQRTFFETKIRPILAEHCYECHAVGAEKIGGKLLLDSPESLRRGGESGPALVPGDPGQSLLIQALRYEDLEMPPEKPLPEAVTRDFITWIEMGAPDPRSASAGTETVQLDEEASAPPHWSLRAVRSPDFPEVEHADWPRDPLDRFVLARMEAAGLHPAPDAEPRVLIRRLSYDLIGLPPTGEEVDAFAAAYRRSGREAVARLVDRLLASPHFGERWGRHWLDVARYAESNGNDGLSRNPTFPHAWRYRDYVIAALNADVPYDRFLTEQIAGDLLPAETPGQRDRHLIATGFLALGAKPAKAMNKNFAMDVVADQIDVVGTGILGLSVGCARCHDHKFDPIPTRDYYALAGIFTSTETMWGLAANEKLTAPKTDLHILQAAPQVPPPDDFVETVLVLESNTGKPKPVPEPPWEPGTQLAMGARDREKPGPCKLNIKGSAQKIGPEIPRGFLSAVPLKNPPEIEPGRSGRLALARWLTAPDHPLTARVFVNRIWHHLFGRGIVATPDDFGIYGERPTHPDLLDHLSKRFIGENGWSLKETVRDIVLSRTYQLSSRGTELHESRDPENRWLARHSLRRLDAESLRDGMLQASGELELAPADGSLIRHRDILVNLANNLHVPSRHRSIYLCYLRNSPPPSLAAFDLPRFTGVTGKRDVSTVPAQALYLFNNPFVIEQAQRFAQRLTREESASPSARIRLAYQRALQREPLAGEVRAAGQLLETLTRELGSPEQAWAAFCQSLLASNEFRYVD